MPVKKQVKTDTDVAINATIEKIQIVKLLFIFANSLPTIGAKTEPTLPIEEHEPIPVFLIKIKLAN